MARAGRFVFEIEAGPALRTAFDVVDFATELIELVPEWHAREREEMTERCNALIERMNEMRFTKKET